MTTQNTFSGRNIDVAVANAAQNLGLEATDVRYEVLAGQAGGFALIRVVTGEAKPTPKPSRSQPQRSEQEASSAPEEQRSRPDDRGPRRDDRGPRRDDRGPRRGDRPEPHGRRGDPLPEVPSDGPSEVQVVLAEGVTLSHKGEAVCDALEQILTQMGFGLEMFVDEDEDAVKVDLTTDVYGEVLTARDLALLGALEYLVDKMVNPTGDDRKKVFLDVNDTKKKLDEDLGRSALDLARRALEEERVFKMGPLDPRARRLVHIALREVNGVTTQSEGEGVFRRVCIIPG